MQKYAKIKLIKHKNILAKEWDFYGAKINVVDIYQISINAM
jgi:hypothetical protein